MVMRSAIMFQERVDRWILTCFNKAIARNKVERNARFLEEALELVQSLGMSQGDVDRLVRYVYGRKKGEPSQEVGGVEVCLAALCTAAGIDMNAAREAELARISSPEVMDKVRRKHAAKPADVRSPLPGILE